MKTLSAKSVNDPFFVLRHFEWPNLVSQWSKNEFLHSLALEPLERFVEIAKRISPRSVGRKAEGRVRWVAHESAGLTMKRAERIVTWKAAPVLRCGAARVLAQGQRSGARSGGGGGFAPSGRPEQSALVMKRPVAQAFQPAGSRNFPVPCASLSALANWGLESPQNPQTRMSALRAGRRQRASRSGNGGSDSDR